MIMEITEIFGKFLILRKQLLILIIFQHDVVSQITILYIKHNHALP